jgi:alkylation response protein AidB-like acyl-CoA dehydrogenase
VNGFDPPHVRELRAALRRFAEEDVPQDLRIKSQRQQVLMKDDYLQWMSLLQRRGWATAHWPREHGGLEWSRVERFVFEDELGRLGLPWVLPFGVKYVGPVIYTFGTPEQQRRFLPDIANNRVFWAQGYSEPGAGSDLAALRTMAVRDGDHYRVTGQKIWTTYAQWADWIFCLVRTDRQARPQEGISFLLIDMTSPGIRVEAIATMDGYRHVNEVWFEDVVVPVANRIGEEGKGWTCAKYLLKNERTAGALVGQAAFALNRLEVLAARDDDAPCSGQAALLRQRVAELRLRFFALEAFAYQAVDAMDHGFEHGAEASIIKIRGAELYQDIAETIVEVLGPAGIAYDPAVLNSGAMPPLEPNDAMSIVKNHLYNRAATIFGGSSEIQRQIIVRSVLGL